MPSPNLPLETVVERLVADATPVVPDPTRGLLFAYGLGLLVFGGVWLLVLVPLLRGVVLGLRTGDWWTPFDRRGTHRDGSPRWGPLANGGRLRLFRAPEPDGRTRRGLLGRWVVWVYVAAGLGYYPVVLLTDAVGVLLGR